ncbi:hypothetical protein RRF57_011801 [Xylaria bambusicola]|uniref:Uncharacterized protein n=1 Tax=Xylaria bambusicola TaxID=326684 RepID=A0AAN7V347_9PEZI
MGVGDLVGIVNPARFDGLGYATRASVGGVIADDGRLEKREVGIVGGESLEQAESAFATLVVNGLPRAGVPMLAGITVLSSIYLERRAVVCLSR